MIAQELTECFFLLIIRCIDFSLRKCCHGGVNLDEYFLWTWSTYLHVGQTYQLLVSPDTNSYPRSFLQHIPSLCDIVIRKVSKHLLMTFA
jgi:hypothetical protein